MKATHNLVFSKSSHDSYRTPWHLNYNHSYPITSNKKIKHHAKKCKKWHSHTQLDTRPGKKHNTIIPQHLSTANYSDWLKGMQIRTIRVQMSILYGNASVEILDVSRFWNVWGISWLSQGIWWEVNNHVCEWGFNFGIVF